MAAARPMRLAAIIRGGGATSDLELKAEVLQHLASNAVDLHNEGLEAVDAAVQAGKVETARILIAVGVDHSQSADAEEFSPLHSAARLHGGADAARCTQLLLEAGFLVDTVSHGLLPLHVVVTTEAASVLIRGGSTVTAEVCDFHAARGNTTMADFLQSAPAATPAIYVRSPSQHRDHWVQPLLAEIRGQRELGDEMAEQREQMQLLQSESGNLVSLSNKLSQRLRAKETECEALRALGRGGTMGDGLDRQQQAVSNAPRSPGGSKALKSAQKQKAELEGEVGGLKEQAEATKEIVRVLREELARMRDCERQVARRLGQENGEMAEQLAGLAQDKEEMQELFGRQYSELEAANRRLQAELQESQRQSQSMGARCDALRSELTTVETGLGQAQHEAEIAVGETVILLHPPVPISGVSIGTNRGCHQHDSLADG